MSKSISISLSSSSIDKAITELNSLNKKIEDLPNKLTEEIAKDAVNFLHDQYANKSYYTDSPSIPEISYAPTEYGHVIIGRGEEILYDEFGTGEIGKQSASGEFLNYRSQFDLKDYNSGEHIKVDQYGRHYWYYNGKYTQGIPAGKQFFNTRNYILKDGVKKAIKKVMGEL